MLKVLELALELAFDEVVLDEVALLLLELDADVLPQPASMLADNAKTADSERILLLCNYTTSLYRLYFVNHLRIPAIFPSFI